MATWKSLCFAILLAVAVLAHGKKEEQEEKDECEICKDFVVSFNKRLKETANSGFDGGSTAWEEEKLGSYANSEVRLVEIMDSVCSGDRECHKFVEEYEEDVENWWFQIRRQSEGKSDLEQWLCHKELVLCCPDNRYGPTCLMCPGGPDDICTGKGKCAGSGSRFGNGTCLCNEGYVGEVCTLCHQQFYMVEDALECRACDISCALTCVEGGPKGCVTCDKGFIWDRKEGCQDIDDCKHPHLLSCTTGTYCENIPGGYECKDCDDACVAGCLGPGSSACIRCADGYRMNNSTCEDIDECQGEQDVCEEETYCENQKGSYVCESCHKSCRGGCSGFGSHQCIDCSEGYEKVNSVCQDIDECKRSQSKCKRTGEVCSNTEGSYHCSCGEGYITKSDGKCVPRKQKKEKTATKSPTPSEEEREQGKTGENSSFDSDDDDSDNEAMVGSNAESVARHQGVEDDVEKVFDNAFSDDSASTDDEAEASPDSAVHSHEEL